MQVPVYRGVLAALSLSFAAHALLFLVLFAWFAGRQEDVEPSVRLRLRLIQPSTPEVRPSEPARPARRVPPPAPERNGVEPEPEQRAPAQSPDARRMMDQAIESIRSYAPPPDDNPYAPDLSVNAGAGETIETYRGAGGTFHVRIGKRCFEFEAADDLDGLAPSAVWRFARCPPSD